MTIVSTILSNKRNYFVDTFPLYTVISNIHLSSILNIICRFCYENVLIIGGVHLQLRIVHFYHSITAQGTGHQFIDRQRYLAEKHGTSLPWFELSPPERSSEQRPVLNLSAAFSVPQCSQTRAK